MPEASPVASLRLILWPSLITLAVSILRLYLEVQGSITSQSGGGGALLGITWLVFVFGAWFGWRLRRAGSQPRVRKAWLWSLLAFLLLAIVGAFLFGGIDPKDTSAAAFEQLRAAVLSMVGLASAMALVGLVSWWRLAFTLLLYAIPARLTVLVLTYLAKTEGWNTHYTRLGPAGIERELADTMFSAGIAQLGFWVPFTVVAGGLAGNLAALLVGRRSAGNIPCR